MEGYGLLLHHLARQRRLLVDPAAPHQAEVLATRRAARHSTLRRVWRRGDRHDHGS